MLCCHWAKAILLTREYRPMMNGNRFSFETTTGPVPIIRNWGEAEGLTFFGFLGGFWGLRWGYEIGLPQEATATDTVISYSRSFLLSEQDPYQTSNKQ